MFDSDKLGLSQLYQLRGRVGRSDKLAYAYFTYRQDKILNEDAYKRLASITEYSELGSGFKIAMRDLEIRGAGNILGREQHGHMMKVGYDMYARLLKEAVAELKGQKAEQRVVAELDVDVEAFAPDDYIPVQSERIDFYRRLAGCGSIEEIASVAAQVQEVYGSMPRPVQNLVSVARLKLLASSAGGKQSGGAPRQGRTGVCAKAVHDEQKGVRRPRGKRRQGFPLLVGVQSGVLILRLSAKEPPYAGDRGISRKTAKLTGKGAKQPIFLEKSANLLANLNR